MIQASCKFCDWTEKTNGVYASHYASRQHLKNEHPVEFASMNKDEHAIRNLQSELNQRFGLAVSYTRLVRERADRLEKLIMVAIMELSLGHVHRAQEVLNQAITS